MRVHVLDAGGQGTTGLEQYVGLRLMSVLDQLVRHVESVTVALDDVTDAESVTVAHRCRMTAQLNPEAQIAVEQARSGRYASIDGAAEQLARVVKLASTAGPSRREDEVSARRAMVRALRSAPEPPHRSSLLNIDVRARGFELTEALRRHAERRVTFAIGRFGQELRSLSLDLDDVNGPRGGVDKRCQITARLRDGEVRVTEIDEDAYRAIDHAAARLRRAVTRRVDRRRGRSLRLVTKEALE